MTADAVQGTVPDKPPVGSVFALGWLMAQIFGPLPRRNEKPPPNHLPTISELDRDHRMDLAFVELEDLLAPYEPHLSSANVKAAWSKGLTSLQAEVQKLHLGILEQLVRDYPQLSAYQLGRALSDTCWLPDESPDGAAVFFGEFVRYRLAILQTWLTEASSTLPAQSAATVSRSLQNWQDWTDINARTITRNWSTARKSVVPALRTQASAWHALLVGESDPTGLATADAWVLAGESLVQTTRRLMGSILRRYWPVVVIVAAATGGLLYLAIDKSAGTAKVWTSLVTVAATVGVSGASLKSAASKAASGIEQDVWHTASLDARAWGITWLPPLQQSRRKRRQLAARGMAAPQVKKELEAGASKKPPGVTEPPPTGSLPEVAGSAALAGAAPPPDAAPPPGAALPDGDPPGAALPENA
jgi:hypothetical protein